MNLCCENFILGEDWESLQYDAEDTAVVAQKNGHEVVSLLQYGGANKDTSFQLMLTCDELVSMAEG